MRSLVVIVVAGIILWLLAEFALPAFFGCIGAGAVWLVTFGRIRLEPSEAASLIGGAVVFICILLAVYFLRAV